MDFFTDNQLEEALQRSEPPISDNGFSESVLDRLPKKRRINTKPRCWTLAGAAAMGSFLTLLLAPPVEYAFSLYRISHGHHTTILSVLLLIAILTIPTSWILYSQVRRDS
jgi:hypothetical protein